MIYVAENGSDTALGNHPQSPFATIKHALSQATAGDVVHVYAGEYTETFLTVIPRSYIAWSNLAFKHIKPQCKANLMMHFY